MRTFIMVSILETFIAKFVTFFMLKKKNGRSNQILNTIYSFTYVFMYFKYPFIDSFLYKVPI